MPSLDPNLYTVAWIAPLEIEVQAALQMLDKVHLGGFPAGPGDDYVFYAGEISGHNVVVATFAAGQPYGTSSATAIASHIRKTFPNLWFGLLVGVAAGLPNLSQSPPLDIRLGDVIVALNNGDNPAIVPYGLGKEKGGDFGFQLLRNGFSLPQTTRIVVSAISKIKARERDTEAFLGHYKNIAKKAAKFSDPGQDTDYLYCSRNAMPVSRPRRPDSERTRVWYGSIGSGDKLLKSARDRDKLRDDYNVIGLEMEAAGVMNEIPVGVIRGVCDYGDERKNKDWQPYAAAMGAAYAKAVLLEIQPKGTAQSVPMKYNFTEEDNQCLASLMLSNPEVDRHIIEERKGGLLNDSFQWILIDTEFQKWRSGAESQVLWVKGDAGKGKTMLMIGVIKELLQRDGPESSVSIAYFLCQGTEPQRNNAIAVLRGLLYLLIFQQPFLITHLRRKYDHEGKMLFEGANAFYSLSAVFQKMLHESKQATTYLVVDALDECEEGLPDLLKLIMKTTTIPSVRVKWLVSSRNKDDIEHILGPDHENKITRYHN
ncbi:nucleoside phosphorylase domain-containing protein [Aspergillus granulosus]|uniref:Nucleoside phosphorylase domain-containing protein n=1 Tax=Aspergillus granulosus TaxID=176169 RepID=A0ABR4GTD3_9EURO